MNRNHKEEERLKRNKTGGNEEKAEKKKHPRRGEWTMWVTWEEESVRS